MPELRLHLPAVLPSLCLGFLPVRYDSYSLRTVRSTELVHRACYLSEVALPVHSRCLIKAAGLMSVGALAHSEDWGGERTGLNE